MEYAPGSIFNSRYPNPDSAADQPFGQTCKVKNDPGSGTDAQGKPIDQLNELEWVEGEIYANIWQTDRIARIDPQTGNVVGWIDCKGLLPIAPTHPAYCAHASPGFTLIDAQIGIMLCACWTGQRVPLSNALPSARAAPGYLKAPACQ